MSSFLSGLVFVTEAARVAGAAVDVVAARQAANAAKTAQSAGPQAFQQAPPTNGALQHLSMRVATGGNGLPGRAALSNVSAKLSRLSERANSPGLKTAASVAAWTATNLGARMEHTAFQNQGSATLRLGDMVGALTDAIRAHVLGPLPPLPPYAPTQAGPFHPGPQTMGGTASNAPGPLPMKDAAPPDTASSASQTPFSRPAITRRNTIAETPMRPTTMAPGLGRPSLGQPRPLSNLAAAGNPPQNAADNSHSTPERSTGTDKPQIPLRPSQKEPAADPASHPATTSTASAEATPAALATQTPHEALGVPEGAAWHTVLNLHPQSFDPELLQQHLVTAFASSNLDGLQHIADRAKMLMEKGHANAEAIRAQLVNHPKQEAISSKVDDALRDLGKAAQGEISQIDDIMKTLTQLDPTPTDRPQAGGA